MKKVLSIALAIVMVLSVSVVAFADDTVVLNLDQEDAYIFWSNGNWSTGEFTDYLMTDLIAALQTEGAQLVITRSAETHIEHSGSETYEKFLVTDSWYSGVDVESGYNWVSLGTAGHNSTTEPGVGIIDCISDDGITIVYDGNTIAQALVDGGFDAEGHSVVFISNSSPESQYKVSNISVIVPEGAAAEEAEETEEAEAAEETTEAAESTETSTASSPDTGVALALVPMAIAGIAVVSSKRR